MDIVNFINQYWLILGGVITAGDVIRIQLSSGATTPAIVSSNFRNWVSFTRVGN